MGLDASLVERPPADATTSLGEQAGDGVVAGDLRTCLFERAGDAVESSLLCALGGLHRGGELAADAPQARHITRLDADPVIRSGLSAAPQELKHRQSGTGGVEGRAEPAHGREAIRGLDTYAPS